MITIFNKEIRLTLSTIILVLLSIITTIMGFLYFADYFTGKPKIETVMAGLITGLVVSILQILISWNSFRADSKLASLKIISVLDNRDDRTFYKDFINGSKRKIDVMGTTAKRFFEHFADMESAANNDSKVLLNRLEKGIKVRILLPQKKYIESSKHSDVEQVHQIMQTLGERYKNFEFRYFAHEPTHSIFKVDDKTVIGPTFSNVSSKNTPGVHIRNNSPLAMKYNEYFDKEWEQGVDSI